MYPITDNEFSKLAAYIKKHYGINLREEKKSLVTSRLHSVLAENNCQNFLEYYQYLLADKTGQAAATLVNKITTNHTFFMREADHFFYFRDHLLPHLKGVCKDKDLRIWSAGCSSGEEPYTLAMLIDEFFGGEKMWWDTKILATDISGQVLGQARRGIYSQEKIATLPAQWRLNYFKQHDRENFMVKDKIKKEIIFRRFNLMDTTFPFKKKFHIIFCRNVMIYFDQQTQWTLVQKFYDLLHYGGYLFIGHSESLNRGATKFKYVLPAVYRKEW